MLGYSNYSTTRILAGLSGKVAITEGTLLEAMYLQSAQLNMPDAMSLLNGTSQNASKDDLALFVQAHQIRLGLIQLVLDAGQKGGDMVKSRFLADGFAVCVHVPGVAAYTLTERPDPLHPKTGTLPFEHVS